MALYQNDEEIFKSMNEQELEKKILELLEQDFNLNYEKLKQDSGHTLSPYSKEMAWKQVRLYWEKLKEVARKVTETEVKLVLPEQKTPGGRAYTLEGVVDIVQEENKVVMYDIKTHEADDVRSTKEVYSQQLNVYAYIWQKLRGQKLNEIAVIATAPPKKLRELDSNTLEYFDELEQWEPIVNLDFQQDEVKKCISEFGATVDDIESGRFYPPDPKKLNEKLPGKKSVFGTFVCRHCDARFSCSSYKDFVKTKYNETGYKAMKYYLDDYGEDEERSSWVNSIVEVQEDRLREV